MAAVSSPPSPSPSARLRLRRLPRGAAFWVIAATSAIFLAASSAPSPLYPVYQQRFGFSATTLTEIFSIYAVALLAALLVVGALSDHVGRRPVIAGAIVLEAAALGLFVAADGVEWLIAARIVQGVATGAAISTLGATLIDLAPAHAPGRGGVVNGVAPLSGLAVGALGCGLLVQLAPAPTILVYVLLLAAIAAAGVAVAVLPETSARRPGAWASLRPQLGVPRHLRAQMLAVTPVLLASWALGGLYLSLGPSVAARLLGAQSHITGGLVVTLLCGTGALTAVALRDRAPGSVLRLAALLLAAGMTVTLAGLEVDALALAALGTIIAGVGFGASALGAFGSLAQAASPTERGEVFAVAFVISYLAFSLPAVAAGLASSSVGLRPTTLVYGAAIVVLALAALAATRRLTSRGETTAPAPG